MKSGAAVYLIPRCSLRVSGAACLVLVGGGSATKFTIHSTGTQPPPTNTRQAAPETLREQRGIR